MPGYEKPEAGRPVLSKTKPFLHKYVHFCDNSLYFPKYVVFAITILAQNVNIDRICSGAQRVIANTAVGSPLDLVIVKDNLQGGENRVVFPVCADIVAMGILRF